MIFNAVVQGIDIGRFTVSIKDDYFVLDNGIGGDEIQIEYDEIDEVIAALKEVKQIKGMK